MQNTLTTIYYYLCENFINLQKTNLKEKIIMLAVLIFIHTVSKSIC